MKTLILRSFATQKCLLIVEKALLTWLFLTKIPTCLLNYFETIFHPACLIELLAYLIDTTDRVMKFFRQLWLFIITKNNNSLFLSFSSDFLYIGSIGSSGHYCGSILPPKYKYRNFATLHFWSDQSVTKPGFEMNYTCSKPEKPCRNKAWGSRCQKKKGTGK